MKGFIQCLIIYLKNIELLVLQFPTYRNRIEFKPSLEFIVYFEPSGCTVNVMTTLLK